MFVFKKIKSCLILLMVPPVVSLLQATCKRDMPHHLQLICFWVDARIVYDFFKQNDFKQNTISTINSTLFFNGIVSQVRKGNPYVTAACSLSPDALTSQLRLPVRIWQGGYGSLDGDRLLFFRLGWLRLALLRGGGPCPSSTHNDMAKRLGSAKY